MTEVIIWKQRPPDGMLEGLIYGDGSGYDVTDDRVKRCGWGVVQIRISGVDTVHQEAELYGPLPGELQDTPAAEAYAFYMFLRFTGAGPHVYHVDNQWVVD